MINEIIDLAEAPNRGGAKKNELPDQQAAGQNERRDTDPLKRPALSRG